SKPRKESDASAQLGHLDRSCRRGRDWPESEPLGPVLYQRTDLPGQLVAVHSRDKQCRYRPEPLADTPRPVGSSRPPEVGQDLLPGENIGRIGLVGIQPAV